MEDATTMKAPPVLSPPEGEPLPHLSRAQFWACWAIAVALFFFDTGPIWRHPWDFGTFNDAVLWSYLPIPLLVAGCLLWSRRFSLRALFLDTLELTLLKYVTTFGVALVLWEITPVPKAEHPAPARRAEAPAVVEPALAPTPIDRAQTGSVGGSVVDEQGRPLAGALVFVSAGLSAYVFAPPREVVTLGTGDHGVTPPLALAMAGQRVLARSDDQRLHTAVGSQDGATLFNVPLLRSGEPTELPVQKASGVLTVSCNVHRGEAPGRLVVLTHPFSARSDGEGRFRLSGVPAGHLRLSALREDGEPAEATIDLAPGGTGELRLSARR